MKILGRKLTAIALLSVFMVSAFALSVVSFAYKPAKAQQQINLPDNIVYKNIEDCVYDITAATTAGGIQYANGLEQRDLGYVTKEDVIISDTLGQDKINIEPTRYAGDSSLFGFYTKKGSECQPDYNGNQYEGNIYVWNKSTSQAKYAQNQILFYAGADDTFVTFRMRYTTGNLYQFNEDVPNLGSWNYYHRYAINTDGSVAISADNANVASHTTSALLADLQAREESATALYETGDMLLVTIGSFHTGTEATNYYFKVVNETKGYVAYELLEQGAYASSQAGSVVIYWQGIAREETRFNLCGVNKPLFADLDTNDNCDYEIEETLPVTYAGKSVTEVALKEGYSHIEGTEQVLRVGENKIAVNYASQYFGNSYVTAYVTVNVDKAPQGTFKNIEDCVYDITAATTAGGIQYANGLEKSDLGKIADNDVIISDALGQSKINVAPTRYTGDSSLFGFYTKKGSECQPDYNGNQYEGNIYVWNKSTSQAMYAQNQILFYAGADDTFVTFRMSYTTGNLYQFNEDVPKVGSWNYFHRYTIKTDGSVELVGDNTSVASYTASALLADLQAREESATVLYETGDMLLVTIGSFHTGTEATNYYFKVVNETKGYVAYEILEQGAYTASQAGSVVIYWQGIAKTETRFNLCGVNKPLFANYNYEVAEELSASYVGKSVTEVALKENYAHVVGNDAVLKAGENKIAVNYVGEYFGERAVSAFVTVNVQEGAKVAIKDIEGNVLAEDVVTGSYTLPVLEREKVFVAYADNAGKLYKQGEVVEISEESVFTLVELDFSVVEKVDLRLSTANDYFGGLRFTAKILTADYEEAVESNIVFMSIIRPVGATDLSGARELVDVVAKEDGYTYAYFTVTNLKYYNFNRQFQGAIAFEVPYASGAEYVTSNVVSASAYDLAVELYNQNKASIAESGMAIYNSTAEEILAKYLRGVIDVTYTIGATGVEFVYTNNVENPWFSLISVEDGALNGDTYTATLKVNVLEGAQDFITAENFSAPVIVRNSATEGYKVAVVNSRTFENGVLTLNVTVKIA